MSDIYNLTYHSHCIKQFYAQNYQSNLSNLSNTSVLNNFELFQSQFNISEVSIDTFATSLLSLSKAIICNIHNIPTFFNPNDPTVHSHIISNLSIPHKCPTKLAFLNYKIYCQKYFVKPLSSVNKFNSLVCINNEFYTHYCKVNNKSTHCFCRIL